MKVYVLIESQWADFEGGSDVVIGVFSKWESAFGKVREKLPDAKRRKDPQRGGWWWLAPEPIHSLDHLGWAIEAHDVE